MDRRRYPSCGLETEAPSTGKSPVSPPLGAGDEVIMSIAGHVSRAMPSPYSHVRMEAKRRALDEIDRSPKADRQQQAAVDSSISGDSVIASRSFWRVAAKVSPLNGQKRVRLRKTAADLN